MKTLLPTLFALLLITGCAALKGNVVVATGTMLGVQVAENPQTQLYEAKLGYGRAEFAFVPGMTNLPGGVPDVMMEIRIENIFKGGTIYQRLAVGKNAVEQPGAALLFAKDASGNLSTNATEAITSKIKAIPTK